jgi:hypothetical protein
VSCEREKEKERGRRREKERDMNEQWITQKGYKETHLFSY